MRVLQVLPGLKTDGIAVVVTNFYRFMDKSEVQFDFAVENKLKNKYDDFIEENGGRIFRLPSHTSRFGMFGYCKSLAKLIKEQKYPVVHIHSNSSILLYLGGLAAKMSGVHPKVIFSSHSRSCEQKQLHAMFKPLIRKMATKRFACSQPAGVHMYGKDSFTLLANAIEFQKYRYQEDRRQDKRAEYALENRYIVGFSGRISPPKNPLFLIDVFKRLKEKLPEAAMLICGDGIMMEQVKNKVSDEGVTDVIFTDHVTSTEDYLSAMDVCLFPSLYEGMPMALLEAQANGLPCICSENIPTEAVFGTKTSVISLNEIDSWVEKLVDLSRNSVRCGFEGNPGDTGFDIHCEVNKLKEFYLSFS